MSKLDWDVFLASLKQNITEEEFDSWLVHLSPGNYDNFSFEFFVPSPFIKGWILSHYKEVILASLKNQLPQLETINLIVAAVKSNNKSPITENSKTPETEELGQLIDNALDACSTDNSLSFNLKPEYTFANFVVGAPNQIAYQAAKRIATDDKVVFNPLFFYGGVGLGKTHLMHSIAWHILESPQKRQVLYLSAEKFMMLYIKYLKNQDMIKFKEIFRSADVLMIDDFQFIGGKDQTQMEFFHSFNSLIEQGKQIIFSADKPPSDLDKVEERIVSRLNAGLVANIHATSYELRLGILESKTKKLGIKLSKEIKEFLAHNITANVRELEGALSRIYMACEAQSIPTNRITLDLVAYYIEDMVRNQKKTIGIETIQKIVAEHYSIKFADMLSDNRSKSVSKARQVAMYLAKDLTKYSFADIGKKFGGKDHSTIMYATKKIASLKDKDYDLQQEINSLTRIIAKSH